MRAQFAAPVAAISLLMISAPAFAGELPFNSPDTHLAEQRAELLHRAAHALYDWSPRAAPGSGTRISNLWLLPTGDAATVVAEYTSTTKDGGLAPKQHLALLTLQGERIRRMRELTDEEGAPGIAQWSAAIGTGHASSFEPIAAAHGEPASPHWTAMIGTGRAATTGASTTAASTISMAGAPEHTPVKASDGLVPAASPHWTSKIGTGRASACVTAPAASKRHQPSGCA